MKHLKACAALITVALITMALTGCFYINLGGDMVAGNGEMETRDINLDDEVTGVRNETSIDVMIDTGLEGKAVLEAESNLIGLVEISQQSDGMVTVGMKPHTSITASKPITLRIPAMEGGRIEINGSGNITQTEGKLLGESFDVRIAGSGDIRLNLETQRLSLSINGSGDMELTAVAGEASADSNGSGNIALSGAAEKLKVSLNGSGHFKGFNFAVQDAHVTTNGSGDAEVNVTGEITGSIGGSGNITYSGNPESVSISDNGSGDVRAR